MFNCYLHGWSSPAYMCPTCNPLKVYYSSGSSGGPAAEEVEISRVHELEARIEKLREALEYYKQFAQLPEEVQLKERVGGGRAFKVLEADDRESKGNK